MKLKKLEDAHQNFFEFQRKLPSFQKTNVEKSFFYKMRFKGVHRLK